MILYCTQLSVPTKMSQTDCPHRFSTVCVDEVFVTQLSVPPQVAQTVGPQKHQQRGPKLGRNMVPVWSQCGPSAGPSVIPMIHA